MPEKADWVYLPGGYPELHARQLSENSPLLRAIQEFADSGKPIVGECGGLMYLGHSVVDKDGASFPMVGLFDFVTTMKDQRLTIGYRKLSYQAMDLETQQIVLRGHEFHSSNFQQNSETPFMSHHIHEKDVKRQDGYRFKNSFAFYSHIYWGSSLGWWEYLLNNFILKHHKL